MDRKRYLSDSYYREGYDDATKDYEFRYQQKVKNVKEYIQLSCIKMLQNITIEFQNNVEEGEE